MSKCYILDEHNKPLNLTHNETLEKMTSILREGTVKDGIILNADKAYEYIEIDMEKEKLRILKDITFYYRNYIENQQMLEQIKNLKKENKTLKKDNLTKLYRADYAMKAVRKYILLNNKNDISYSIVMAYIDKFKNINDTYGHEFGNKVLEKIGSIILNNTRTKRKTVDVERRKDNLNRDITIRYGGEEILILFQNISLENTIKKVENIRQKINDTNIDGVNVTMSFGIYNVDPNKKFLELDETNIYKYTSKMVELADKALYYSKENGRNRTSYYDGETNTCIEVNNHIKK